MVVERSGARVTTWRALWVFAVIAGAAIVPAAEDPAALFGRARALLARGEAAQASPIFEKAVALAPKRADYHYWLAKSYGVEARHSTNAVRLMMIGWNTGEELEAAVRLDPNFLDARLDLIRYYVMAPRLVGGSHDKAMAQVAELEKRDAALGAFASGYVRYREKELGPARKKLEEAVRLAQTRETKVLALTWLGYLSQETQQYDKAFESFEAILSVDPSHSAALYEIGRTAVFCTCRLDRGEEALRGYLTTSPAIDDPSLAAAHVQLGLLLEKKGDVAAAKREIAVARKMDKDVEGVPAHLLR